MYSNPTIIWIAREGGAFTGFKCALCAKRTRPPLLKRHLRALLPSQLCPLGFFKTTTSSLKHTGTQANKQMNKQLKDTNKPKTLRTQSSPVGSSPRRVRFLLSKNADKHTMIAILRVAFPRNFSRGKATQHACECTHLKTATIERHQTPLYVILNDHILLREPHFVSIQDWCLSLFADYRVRFQ